MSNGTAHMNGPSTGKYIDTIDPDDPEYLKQMRRPAEVKEDVRQMNDRSRVSVILNSEAFRRELEEVVEEHIKSGPHPASLLALQQITDLLLPHSRGQSGLVGRGASPVIPINDIKGTEGLGYSKGEKLLRCKLAACYRLVDLCGWGHGIYNHISVRINQEQEHFLINPFGLTYGEVTASSLVKVDMRGDVIEKGTTTLGINKAGFTLHSAIHQARPDLKCVIHLHTPSAVAVSTLKCGFLPMSQESLICGEVSYHEYNGILVDQEERDSLQRHLGPNNKIMFLRNHGVVACGTTIEEAYHYAFNVMAACESQIKALPAGLDNIILVDDEVRQKTFAVGSQGGGGVDTSGRKWKPGELEFEALMRQLDNAGFRTGFVYRQPIIKAESKRERSNDDVEIPPASSSFTYVFDGDYEHSKYMSPIKVAIERQKQHYKAGWLNSPNTYVKKELEETGTTNPKKITKWVQDGSPSNSGTPIKVDNPNQFAPQGEDPKEFKKKQKDIRKDYYEDKVTAGPQSRVLEGLTWEEAQKLQDGTLSMAGDSVIVIGAASKGIIQRDQQHNVQVYKSQYQANPFENMTQDEIERYRVEVERKSKGEPEEAPTEESLEPGPDGKLISTEERMQIIQQQQVPETTPEKTAAVEVKHEVEPPKPTADDDDDVFVDDSSEPISPTTNGSSKVTRNKRYSQSSRGSSRETNVDDILNSYGSPSNNKESEEPKSSQLQRSESTREPPRSPELIDELKQKNFERSKSDRWPRDHKINGDEKTGSPSKSDTLKSTDSASGGETLEDHSSKEGSPTKDIPSPTKDKKKKKNKFRMPSFSKSKKKESKESTI
ncbi:alpha-adducin-like isoform X3 [Ostrea edulis]|uniref:alpha-adducin-like isoform X3 n=1 Tax=Ostrea edulis TaxID=37623 RepID=UPI0024AEA6A1|nr:alpha-adducin-like isoform X3 [Ostrea edulis]XP_056004244.1 alpha-adducin-like isoform X3 [Ostrea edulis]